jgi:hypothetical protein
VSQAVVGLSEASLFGNFFPLCTIVFNVMPSEFINCSLHFASIVIGKLVSLFFYHNRY